MIKVIHSPDPKFLPAYACPEVEIQSHPWTIAPEEKFIEFDGEWVVKQMTMSRAPRFCSKHRELRTAIFKAK